MTVLLPRLDRDSAARIVDEHRHTSISDLSALLPVEDVIPTYSPVGGGRIDRHGLSELRRKLLLLARDAGMPEPGTREQLQRFEGRAARVVRQHLDITPHEASQDDAWSYLTCCWLLDIAAWRFGWGNIERFVGHLNRNTFRRMWWRAEILGDAIDLAQLGEDEFTNIMERPTLFSDRRLARAIAVEFLDRVQRDEAQERMRLMREVTKRLLRLTPFVAFSALDEKDLRLVVADAFEAAAAGIAGLAATMPHRGGDVGGTPSSEVVSISTMTILEEVDHTFANSPKRRAAADGFEEVAQVAMDIARRTGRVTNMNLREVVPITSEEARAVFQSLMESGQLVRRGVKRGTHYVLPDARTTAEASGSNGPSPSSAPTIRPSETALRRLLRRGR